MHDASLKRNTSTVKRLSPRQFTSEQVIALNQLYSGLNEFELQVRDVKYTIRSTYVVTLPADTVCLALSLNGRPAWLEIGWSLLKELLSIVYPFFSMDAVPEAYMGAMIEAGTAWILDYIEQNAGWKIEVSHVETGTTLELLREQLRAKQGIGRSSVGFTIELSSGQKSTCRLHMSQTELVALAERIPRVAESRHGDIDDFPIDLRIFAGFTDIPLSDLRTVKTGDLLVLDHAWVDQDEVLVWFSSSTQPMVGRIDGRSITVTKLDGTYMNTELNEDSINAEELPIRLVFEVGRTQLQLGDLKKMGPGFVLSLNKGIDTPIDIVANGKKVGVGDLVKVDGNVAVLIRSIF